MPQWTERFQNHPVHQQLQSLKDSLPKVEEKADTVPSPEVTESIERLKQIADQTESVFSTLDPLMTSQAPLDNINNYLQQTVAYCNQYLADGNAVNLDTANANADGVLIQLGSLPIIRTTQDLEGLSESIQSLRRS